MSIIEALPLTIFLAYIRRIDTQVPQNFEAPFVAGAFAAIAVINFSIYKKNRLDRILLGVNLYLISGGLAFITHQGWLNNLYGQLHVSGVILWIVVVGIGFTLFSPAGFIGKTSSDTQGIKKYSFYMLSAAVVMFAVSFLFRGNILVSEIAPFIVLFVLQKTFREKLKV